MKKNYIFFADVKRTISLLIPTIFIVTIGCIITFKLLGLLDEYGKLIIFTGITLLAILIYAITLFPDQTKQQRSNNKYFLKPRGLSGRRKVNENSKTN